MLSNLNQPFPAPNHRNALRMAAALGFFVAAFLLFFQPFGLQQVPAGLYKQLAICGYGLVTFICVGFLSAILPGWLPAWFNAAQWTVKKEIGMTLLNFMVVGFFNLLYTFYAFRLPLSLQSLLYFEAITLAVGLLPVSLAVMLRHNRLLAANLKMAREMNTELAPLTASHNKPESGQEPMAQATLPASFTFTSESGNEQVLINKADFLFAEAADNYVELHYLENGVPKKNLIRSSLTRIAETVKADPKMFRCHRTYLVNLNRVTHVSGNAQGLKLELHGTQIEVPVSRKMAPAVKALLHS